jgi:hypothetical protein
MARAVEFCSRAAGQDKVWLRQAGYVGQYDISSWELSDGRGVRDKHGMAALCSSGADATRHSCNAWGRSLGAVGHLASSLDLLRAIEATMQVNRSQKRISRRKAQPVTLAVK